MASNPAYVLFRITGLCFHLLLWNVQWDIAIQRYVALSVSITSLCISQDKNWYLHHLHVYHDTWFKASSINVC